MRGEDDAALPILCGHATDNVPHKATRDWIHACQTSTTYTTCLQWTTCAPNTAKPLTAARKHAVKKPLVSIKRRILNTAHRLLPTSSWFKAFGGTHAESGFILDTQCLGRLLSSPD